SRFQSDSLLECYLGEYRRIKEHTPDVPVTTNFMGTYKPLDYFKWAPYLDVVSWDNYPSNRSKPWQVAFRHDLMRGLKEGMPFMLMEQTPSQQNWQPQNALKRPGVLRLWSYQAVAHGADTVMYFQLRQSRGACEKFHAAVISHAGHENTRTFREVAELGRELKELGDTLIDSRIEARIAILFDWENWWALEYSSGPSIDLKYIPQVEAYYAACWKQKLAVDIVHPDMDLSGYDVVIAPVLYMAREGFAEKMQQFVEAGGTFVTTFMSGIVDENDLVILGGYPGALRRLLGLWVEEIDALFPDDENQVIIDEVPEELQSLKGTYSARLICDVVHSEGAEVLGVFGRDFYAGMPALTRNRVGKGYAWYVATSPEPALIERLIALIAAQHGIAPVAEAPEGVEVTRRVKDGRGYTFYLNHNETGVEIDLGEAPRRELLSGRTLSGRVHLEGRGVMIVADV
ncbi:MAG TPA: beta-galactosidase, partial [Limnochordia bacterium]|nr:beta-galactosidase [Limnochordia bacterium]